MNNLKSKLDKNDSRDIRELEIITKISQSIIKTLDFDEVLQSISDGMAELLEIESAAIYILEADKKLHLGATTPPLDPNMPDFLRKANLNDHPHIKTAISTQKPILIADTHTSNLSQSEQAIIDMRNLRSLLYFPFIREEQALGVLILGTCNKTKNYSESQIELGQTVANQLSVAIQNSQLHNDLKKYNEDLERLVAERTHELEATNEELRSANEELHLKNELISEKNKIVQEQKDEIERSLTNLKSTQAQLIQSEKKASLGILTAGVAHEINNPLNYIMGGYVGLMNELEINNIETDKRISAFLNGIKTGIDRAADIVQGLNQLSRNNDSFDEKCDIHAIIENCLTILNSKFKNRIEIHKNYSEDATFIYGNSGKLHQVFINVILNAIDSIEQSGEIYINSKVAENTFDIIIQDSGCGIPTEHLNKIIDPFFTTKDPGKGTGLGLSIANTIIEEHKGKLKITSTGHKGTSVLIRLPKTL